MSYEHPTRISIYTPPGWTPPPEKHDKRCPFQRPQYDTQQPFCTKDCALYDAQNKQCGLLSSPVSVDAIYTARRICQKMK